MSSLSDALQGLLEFLKKQGTPPPTLEMSVVEVSAGTETDERGRLRIERSELRDPSDYETRFEALIKSGLPWLNVSCIGVSDSKLIVTVELPRVSSDVSARTSVNYSGPSKAVLEHGWDAAQVLALQEGDEAVAMTDDEEDAAQLEGDRETVAALVAHGDPLTKARPVDHWIYFATAEARDRFVDEVISLGFSLTDTNADGNAPIPYCACVSRVDHVDLESIHRVVMTLFAAAKRHDGDYDGWECPVETAD